MTGCCLTVPIEVPISRFMSLRKIRCKLVALGSRCSQAVALKSPPLVPKVRFPQMILITYLVSTSTLFQFCMLRISSSITDDVFIRADKRKSDN